MLFVLLGIPAYLIIGALSEYAFGKLDEKVEANRRRLNVTPTGVRALLMLVAGPLLTFAFALSLPPFLSP